MTDLIHFKIKGHRHVGLNFLQGSKGMGKVDLFYDGKYVITLDIDLTHDMEV